MDPKHYYNCLHIKASRAPNIFLILSIHLGDKALKTDLNRFAKNFKKYLLKNCKSLWKFLTRWKKKCCKKAVELIDNLFNKSCDNC